MTEDAPMSMAAFQEVKIKRKVGQSLGMMVAVSKVEDDKSVIISTVDPNGLVAKYGLFKGLTLHMVCLSSYHNLLYCALEVSTFAFPRFCSEPRDFHTFSNAR